MSIPIEKIFSDDRRDERRKFALRMLRDGTFPHEKIAELAELSLEEVEALAFRTAGNGQTA